MYRRWLGPVQDGQVLPRNTGTRIQNPRGRTVCSARCSPVSFHRNTVADYPSRKLTEYGAGLTKRYKDEIENKSLDITF